MFPSLNLINWKSYPYWSKVVLIHYHYRPDTKLGPGIVAIRIIPCSCLACKTRLSIPWSYIIKYACNQPIYGRVYDCKYSIIPLSRNNCIIMNVLYYGTYHLDYEWINRTIIDGGVMNMSVIISKVNYGAIDAENTSCQVSHTEWRDLDIL